MNLLTAELVRLIELKRFIEISFSAPRFRERKTARALAIRATDLPGWANQLFAALAYAQDDGSDRSRPHG
jgi:hypothetical protein